MIIPKWFNKWLTPDEEQKLFDPGRRVFTFGLLASASLLTLPSLPLQKMPDFEWRGANILSNRAVIFDDVLRTFPVWTLTSKDYPCLSR